MNFKNNNPNDLILSDAPRLLLIIDDNPIMSNIMKSKCFNELMFNSRHYHITLIITQQYCVAFPPEIKTNFDIVFIAKDDCISNNKRCYEHYGGIFPSLSMFNKVLTQINYFSFLSINRTDNSLHNFDDLVTKFTTTNENIPKLQIYDQNTKQNNELEQNNVFDKFDIINEPLDVIDIELEKSKGSKKHNFFKDILECNLRIVKLMKNTNNPTKIKLCDDIIKSNMMILNYNNDLTNSDCSTNLIDSTDSTDLIESIESMDSMDSMDSVSFVSSNSSDSFDSSDGSIESMDFNGSKYEYSNYFADNKK